MAASSGSEPARPRVIYVMGAGHSGSTIFGVALGNCEGIFYAGELEEWVINAGEAPLGGTERVRFWKQVREQVDDADAVFGMVVNRCIERSSSVFRLNTLGERRRLRPTYRRVTEELILAITRTSANDTIVDTSHFPLRARELKALPGIDLFLVFLAREPQGVVSSELRSIHRHEVAKRRVRALVTNANLWLTNLLSVVVFRSHPESKRVFVSHEEFLTNPSGTLQRVLDMVGSTSQVPDLSDLRTGYPLLGNKLIRSERVALREAAGPPPRTSLLTAIVQAPWRPVLARLAPRIERTTSAEATPVSGKPV
jgi:hypothetical protein